jgi:hypothetical protein
MKRPTESASGRVNEPAQPAERSYLHDVFETLPILTLAAHHNVTIAVWRATPTVPEIQLIDTHLAKFSREHKRFASIVVIDAPHLRPPGPPARQEHAKLTIKYEAKALGATMIIDGDSVKHQVFRFVLSTLQLMSSPRVPQKIFGSEDDAARWIGDITPGIVSSELQIAIQEARRLVSFPDLAISSPVSRHRS